jgi:FMN phosphatase YigB (HAD superfamily)
MAIKLILFDVADTLLHKPMLWPTIATELARDGIAASEAQIARAHRATRDLLPAPDRTGRDFYLEFNARFLDVLGVLPGTDLVERIYLSCRYLPWAPFADTEVLGRLNRPLGIVSNWDDTLRDRLKTHLPLVDFGPVMVSYEAGMAKPDSRLYEKAIELAGERPEHILYIGDSVRLDMVPATKAGLRCLLIDRSGYYPLYQGERLTSLYDLTRLIDDEV